MTARMQSLPAGTSNDPAINAILDFSEKGFADTQMFGLVARRPELLKRVAGMFAYFLGGEGGLIEPELLELMRIRGAGLNACTYCATVRLQPVADVVGPKESALGLADISGMTKSEAVATFKDSVRTDRLTPREVAAIALVDRIIVDPHSVDDALCAELRRGAALGDWRRQCLRWRTRIRELIRSGGDPLAIVHGGGSPGVRCSHDA